MRRAFFWFLLIPILGCIGLGASTCTWWLCLVGFGLVYVLLLLFKKGQTSTIASTHTNNRIDLPQKLAQPYIGTLQHRLQYPLTATHSTPPKSTEPLILGYSVIAIVLLSSALGKACLSVCPVALLVFSKLEARGLIGEWLKEYNRIRLHSALSYRPPAPEAIMPVTLT